jgi:hypothetical protein
LLLVTKVAPFFETGQNEKGVPEKEAGRKGEYCIFRRITWESATHTYGIMRELETEQR